MNRKKSKDWKISFVTERGLRHKKMNLKCQDCVAGKKYGKYQAIALADGAGKSDMAYYGAQKAAETMVELLTKNFEELYYMEIEKIRYNIIVNVREELYKLCDESEVTLDDVKSTLLAAVIDTENNRCIIVHLGDGYVGTKVGDTSKIISFPMNGFSRSLTYLTSTFPVISKIQVRRGQMEHMNAVFLMSDGWCEKNRTAAAINHIFQQYENGQIELDGYTDDIGIITLSV